jgi:hypothetical protein
VGIRDKTPKSDLFQIHYNLVDKSSLALQPSPERGDFLETGFSVETLGDSVR